MYQLVAIHSSLIVGCVHGGINLARVFNRVYGKVGIHLYDYRNGGVVARLYPTLIIKPVFADFVTLMSRPILLKRPFSGGCCGMSWSGVNLQFV